MGLEIEDVNFLNPSLGETVGTDFLRGNIGDVITATIKVRFDGDYVIATSITPNDGDTVLIANAGSNLTNAIRDQRHLWTDSPLGFGNVSEGDQITIDDRIGGVTTKTVIEVISSQLLLMDTIFSPVDTAITYPANSVAYVSTPMQGIEYSFGLIENNKPPNFNSKIDGNRRNSIAQGLDSAVSTPIVMTQLGAKSNQYGSLQIEGNGIGDGAPSPEVSQAFIITHTFLIDPLSLAGQNQDTKNGKAPDYYKDINCLKYIFKAELSNDLTDPNRKKEIIEFSKSGNTGFLGENFNTGLTNYVISNVVFKRLNGDVSGSMELTTDQTTLTFNITNAENSPFSSSNTKFVLNHWFMPTPEDEYREPQFSNTVNLAKDRNIIQNFLFDRVTCTLDDAITSPPDNLGTDQQIITSFLVEHLSNSVVEVSVIFGMSAESLARILATSGIDYALSISTKNHLFTGSQSDNVTLKIDVASYFTDITDPEMIQTDITFMDHPSTDIDTEGKTALTVRVEDDVVAVAKFVLNRNDITGYTRDGVEVRYRSVTMQVIARKNPDTYFVLDRFHRDLPPNRHKTIVPYGSVPIFGTLGTGSITQDRGFRTPPDDLRKNITVGRRTDLDIGDGFFNYEAAFPFIFRDEEWIPLEGVDDHFYDESLPNNGLNHDWARYAADTDWNIFFQFTVAATKDGTPITYTTESLILVEDYTEGSEWDNESAKCYLVSNGDEIIKGGQSGVSLDKNTEVRADTVFNTAPSPTLPDLVMVIMINVFEKDDSRAQYRYYSKYPNLLTNNVWTGLNGISTATKTNPSGTTFRIAAELKAALLTKDQSFKISWRVYDTRPDLGDPNGMATEDAILMTTENGIIMNVETL